MASADTGPLIPRRRLGAAFRELREAKGETLQQTAKALLFSPSKLSRLENGLAGEPHPRDVRDLIRHFDVNGNAAVGLQELAEAGRRPGWWQLPPYEYTEELDVYISYESAASQIREYAPVFVPGLMQTADYAREVVSSYLPGQSQETVEHYVAGRLERQRRLRERQEPTPRLHVVTETALRIRVGSPAIMVEQLSVLLQAFDEPSVELHIIPYDAGLYRGIDMTTLTIFDFDVSTDNTIVAFERVGFTEFLEREATVTKYSGILDRLAGYWLDENQSRSLIEDRQREWRAK